MLSFRKNARAERSDGRMSLPLLCISLSLVMMTGCAGTSKIVKGLEEPVDKGILVVGDVIVENINQGLEFDNWDFPVQVILATRNENGTVKMFTVQTDNRGYFFLANVPVGPYALKAVIVPLFGSPPVKLVNSLESYDSPFNRMKHPERPIDSTAKYLPQPKSGPITNLNITWFGLREANIRDFSNDFEGQVIVQTFSESLKNKRFWTQGFVYTREDPLTYFKAMFPNSNWWNK